MFALRTSWNCRSTSLKALFRAWVGLGVEVASPRGGVLVGRAVNVAHKAIRVSGGSGVSVSIRAVTVGDEGLTGCGVVVTPTAGKVSVPTGMGCPVETEMAVQVGVAVDVAPGAQADRMIPIRMRIGKLNGLVRGFGLSDILFLIQ